MIGGLKKQPHPVIPERDGIFGKPRGDKDDRLYSEPLQNGNRQTKKALVSVVKGDECGIRRKGSAALNRFFELLRIYYRIAAFDFPELLGKILDMDKGFRQIVVLKRPVI